MGKKKVRRRFGNELVRQGKPFVIREVPFITLKGGKFKNRKKER